jgi:hypothetical protein
MRPVDYVVDYVKSVYPEAEVFGFGSYTVPIITERYPCILVKYIDVKGKNGFGNYITVRNLVVFDNNTNKVIPEIFTKDEGYSVLLQIEVIMALHGVDCVGELSQEDEAVESKGCKDKYACNFNSVASFDDGSCRYAKDGYDCYGLFLLDTLPSYVSDYLEDIKNKMQHNESPLEAQFFGAELGDYFHLDFITKNGVNIDFGNGNNSLGQFPLYDEVSFVANKNYIGDTFLVYWDWLETTFPCCDGSYDTYSGKIPSITKLERIVTHGGIVFYIDETGEHGLVAAMEDLPSTYEWGCYGEDVEDADGEAIGTGLQNTFDIEEGCSATSIAASEALAYESDGYSDWYLPSKDELVEMYNTIGNGGPDGNKGGFVNEWYWSSSEDDNDDAWDVDFSDGFVGNSYKNSTSRVRVIRAFGYTPGCMDETACNYNPDADMADGSCIYPELGYDCDGTQDQVGDYVEGGIIFQINEDGTGLVSALEDLPSTYQWGCRGNVTGADGLAIGTGLQNTLDVSQHDCSKTLTAASEALVYESQGYSDWYLPSKDELVEMYNTIGYGGPEGNIGGFVKESYWSSSEHGSNGAWYVSFGNVSTNYNKKHRSSRVRVIRAF